MKHTLLIASLILPVVYSKTSGEICEGIGEQASDGNWYCSEVLAITYRNISQTGVYNRTISVNPSTGICGHETIKYEGTDELTPLFGEVSMHLRGPMNVSQLAVYQLPSDMHTLQKRDTIPFYNRRRALHPRNIESTRGSALASVYHSIFPSGRSSSTTTSCTPWTTTVTVTVTDCEPDQPTETTGATPDTTYVGPRLPCMPTPTPSTSAAISPDSDCPCKASSPPPKAHGLPVAATATLPSTKRADAAPEKKLGRRAGADWSRVAYYTSTAPAQATGLSFLANVGDPEKSGTFDYAFGNSLAYVSSDGSRVTSDSMPFDGRLDTSEEEIAVFSDKACDQDCPYWRPNATSHFGWSGSSKAFFIEFQMDHYQNRGNGQGLMSDAPAWWFLNAAIPRVLQYGNDRNNIPCSCWSTGCGEFDAFEVLGNGEERAKSTLHRQGNLEGGDSNYFKRPVGHTIKFAVVWNYPDITALVLDDDFEFGEALTDAEVNQLVAYDSSSWVHSLFTIGT